MPRATGFDPPKQRTWRGSSPDLEEASAEAEAVSIHAISHAASESQVW